VIEKLLRLVGPVHIAGGLLLFASAFLPSASVFLQTTITGDNDYVWSAFFATVLGPTIASWGVLFTALVHQFHAAPSLTIWRALLLSVVIWAPLDTALCLKFGVTIGAIINSIVFIALVWLLIAAKKTIR
jgi:hypothetical protein